MEILRTRDRRKDHFSMTIDRPAPDYDGWLRELKKNFPDLKDIPKAAMLLTAFSSGMIAAAEYWAQKGVAVKIPQLSLYEGPQEKDFDLRLMTGTPKVIMSRSLLERYLAFSRNDIVERINHDRVLAHVGTIEQLMDVHGFEEVDQVGQRTQNPNAQIIRMSPKEKKEMATSHYDAKTIEYFGLKAQWEFAKARGYTAEAYCLQNRIREAAKIRQRSGLSI